MGLDEVALAVNGGVGRLGAAGGRLIGALGVFGAGEEEPSLDTVFLGFCVVDLEGGGLWAD